MAYFTHSSTMLINAFKAFAVFHYPTASAKELVELAGAGMICYKSKRGWLSYLNNDIDEDAVHRSLYAVHNYARKLCLPYRDGLASDNTLLRRVIGVHGIVYALNPCRVYGGCNGDAVSIKVPSKYVDELKMQLELMQLLDA